MNSKFYVSDSFTIQINPPTTLHAPGVFNQGIVIPPASLVEVFINSCSYNLTLITDPANQGVNSDIMIGLYDISSGAPVFLTNLPFSKPFGGATNGQLMNHCVRFGQGSAAARREFSGCDALFSIVTPDVGSFQLGAYMQFNLGVPVLGCYDYHISGSYVVHAI